jgi:hypothetical protein
LEESVIRRLDELEKRVAELEKIIFSKPVLTNKIISLQEFLSSKKPKTESQKVLVVAYYLEKFKGLEFFNVNDIKDAFRLAKESPPSNINDVVNQNIRKGYMMRVEEEKDGLKAWTLTNKGQKFVESDLQHEQ